PVISDFLPGFLYDPAQMLETTWSVKDIVLRNLFTGDFPVFPWIVFPLVGFVLGRRIVVQKIQGDLPWWLPLGIGFIALGLGLGYAASIRPDASIVSGYVAPLSFYPNSFSMVLFQLGMALVFIFVLYYLYDIRESHRQKTGICASFFMYISRSSLTFYFFHYMTIGWPLAALYVISGKYRVFDLMGAWPAFVCGSTAVALLYSGLKVWDKRGGKYKLEWCLVVLTRRFAS
ncbi:MAG: hypothetical protein QG656_2132, partial [Candidatus Hydrogenedentes bacterium]|nr:hypothetical protein [Candidatus Hydrogenedentota bacterium]